MLMFRGNPSHTFYGTGPISADPKVLWSHRMTDFHTTLRGKPIVWKGTGWTGQAVVHEGYVFVGSVGRSLYAFESETGRVRWRLEAGRMFKSSACFYQNRLYIGSTDNFLRCVNARTGQVIWATNMGADCDSSPCVYNDKLYVCGESGHARCLNPRTGQVYWETNLGGTGRGTPPGSNGVESSPALRDGELYASSYAGELFCVGARRGKVLWRAKTHDDTDASAVVTEDFVYTAAEDGASKLYCFDRQGRGRLRWSFAANKKGYWSTPAYKQGSVYIGGQDGRLYAVDAQTGRGKWAFDAKAPIWSSPVWVDDKVIFGSYDTHLYILDARTGRQLTALKLHGRCISTPAVIDGKIYVGTATGYFYCIG